MVARNTKPLKAGSECPPIQKDLLRLYGMFYCPYVQRPRIILDAKNIKYESVNIHLFETKPEWYLEINPLGKVPAIQLNDIVLFESMVICDYLDEVYPDPPLYPSEPSKKGWDKCLIQVYEVKVNQVMIKMFFDSPNSEAVKKITDILNDGLDIFEKELTKRGTKFFFGDRPGMLDYAIFPWLERIPLLQKFYSDFLVLPKERFPKMVEYFENMLKEDAIKSSMADPVNHLKFIELMLAGKTDYSVGSD